MTDAAENVWRLWEDAVELLRREITHPHGRRAHHVGDFDEIRLEVLTSLEERVKQMEAEALVRVDEEGDE